MLRKIIPILFIFIILASAGCMGLKTGDAECIDVKLDEKVGCYRQVALTLAAKGDTSKAMQACGKIDPTLNLNADSEYFITQKDLCYYDVATTSGDSQVCGKISGDAEGSILFGSTASQEMCYTKVNYASLIQRQYKCALLFVFPPILFYAFYANRNKKI